MQELSTSDLIQVRCPECFRSYNVAVADMKVSEPKFECINCQTRFLIKRSEALRAGAVVTGLRFGESVAGTQVEKPVVSHHTGLDLNIYSCPKCSETYPPGQSECTKCGVVFFKFKDRQINEEMHRKEQIFSASKEVRELWESVLADYENIEAHQNFISAAWADQSLEYAALKYGSILEVVPQDEIALRLAKEVQELTKVKFEMVASQSADEGIGRIEKISFIDGVQSSFKKFKWINLILLCCGIIIGTGLILPHLRNLIGFGSSILFFILALKYYFRII